MNKPTRKPFEKHLYDRFDNPAKSALVSILENEGHDIPNLKENYYADVESIRMTLRTIVRLKLNRVGMRIGLSIGQRYEYQNVRHVY